MQIAGPAPSRILLLLVEGGEDAWPPSGQTGDAGCEWESGGGAGLLVRDSGEGTGSQGLDQQAEP